MLLGVNFAEALYSSPWTGIFFYGGSNGQSASDDSRAPCLLTDCVDKCASEAVCQEKRLGCSHATSGKSQNRMSTSDAIGCKARLLEAAGA